MLVLVTFEYINYQKSIKALDKKLNTLSSAYSLLLSEPVALKDKTKIELLSLSLISDPSIDGVLVKATDGTIFESYGVAGNFDEKFTARHSINHSIEDAYKKVGTIALSMTTDVIWKETKNRLFYELLLLILLIISLLLSTRIAYVNSIGIRLKNLLRSIRNFSRTGVHEDITVKFNDEIGEVINAYNAMQKQRILSRKNLEKYQAKLVEEVNETKRLSQRLSYEASHDLLTGLINRREFEIQLNHLISTAHTNHKESCFCFLDLDQFKIINDTSGHIAGDELLKQLSALFNDKVSSRDVIARLGGDEFGLLLPNCNMSKAKEIAENLLAEIKSYKFKWEERSYRIGASIGVVQITQYSENIETVMKDADMACYMAKEAGRNRVYLHNENDLLFRRKLQQMEWVSKINSALEKDQFQLWYQPIVKSHGEKNCQTLCHFEVLVRMLDKQEIINPGRFLPAAERYNLSPQIDRWVLNKTLDFVGNSPEILDELEICSINLSGLTFADEYFVSFAKHKISNSKVPPEKICFEITETAAISNLSVALMAIQELKELGCLFSLDDFGSGLSSFSYLKNLPVDFIKIDGEFIKGIHNNPINQAMVKSIHEVGKVMNKKTIAEFVESEEDIATLKTIGVDYLQGYAIQEPEVIPRKYLRKSIEV